MRRCVRTWFLLGIMGCIGLSNVFAQTYHVYRPVSEKQAADSSVSSDTTPDITLRKHCFEIQMASIYSDGSITDTQDNEISRGMYGWRGRLLVRLSDIVSLGVEGQTLKSHDMKTKMLVPFRRKEWAALAKLTLTPGTTPPIYVLLGIGQSAQRTKFVLQQNELKRGSMMLVGGIGAEINVWKGLFLSGEYMLHYDGSRWENFVIQAPRVRHNFALGLSYQF